MIRFPPKQYCNSQDVNFDDALIMTVAFDYCDANKVIFWRNLMIKSSAETWQYATDTCIY